MDPAAAWNELISALVDMDWARVQETAEALLDWITQGGFPPEVIVLSGDGQAYLARVVYGPELNRSVVKSVSRFAIQLASELMRTPGNSPQQAVFTLSCSDCDVDSPETLDEAVRSGWTRIRFVPESPSENFLGVCPACRRRDASQR